MIVLLQEYVQIPIESIKWLLKFIESVDSFFTLDH